MKEKLSNSPAAVDALAEKLRAVIAASKPKRLIETGAGGGAATVALARAIRDVSIDDATIFTIELNPKSCSKTLAAMARENLGAPVKILNGLSVPRAVLPKGAPDLPRLPDDMLGQALREFASKADFVLINSAASLAAAEFTYLTSKLRGACLIVVGDSPPVRTAVEADARCTIELGESPAGYCLARFAAVKKRKGTAA